MNHGIIFTGVNYFDVSRKSGGATRIANFLQPHGWNVDIVDFFPFWSKLNLKEYLQNTVNNNTKFIGFSYTWLSQSNEFKEKLKYIKLLYPTIKIILGGQTPFSEDLGADYYIFGYGEEAMLKILNYEFNNGTLPMYTKHFGGRYIDGIHNITSHNLKEYGNRYSKNDFLTPSDILTIELSRGCKFACKFCNYSFIGMKDDTSRSEESIYRELNENYQKWGIINYCIADDTLNDRNEKLIKLKNAVCRLDFVPNFTAYVRIDLLKSHPEHLELLSEANVWGHFYGIETFNRDAGKIIGKGMDSDIVKNLLLDTREYFQKHNKRYRGVASMIAGLPTESIDDMRESHKWLIDNWIDQCIVWHPLHIVKSKGSLQAFGENLEKYGYEKIAPPTPEQYEKYLIKTLINKLNEDTIYWKNDKTDVYEILDLVDEFRKTESGISSWAVWSYLNFYDIDKTLSVRTPSYEPYLKSDYVEKAKFYIQDYIKKKCSK